MLLLIDNYDSFTFNLVQALQELGACPWVVRHDHDSLPALGLRPDLEGVIISPGPGGPKDSGLCLQLLEHLHPQVPVLGICLGHQVLASFGGYPVVRAERIMHGKTSLIEHSGQGLFQDLANPFQTTRYHSLLVDEGRRPGKDHVLEITARSEYGEPMALCFRDRPWMGVQFHPESILCPQGPKLLNNFLKRRKQ